MVRRMDVRVRDGRSDGGRSGGMASRVGASSAVWFALLVAVTLFVCAPAAGADVGAYRCADPAKVYLGNPKLFQKPAVIAADRVYGAISEYREILQKGLTDKDVHYHFLMKKASERFSKAVKAMARKEGHDLVAESGSIEVAKRESAAPPDRTDAVIGEIG
jgi:hypothetical protein